MNWDEKGRLWVIETVDYPNTVRDDKGSGDDRIKICEDTNGDGRADTFTIFAEGLNIPTGFTFHDGGIVVTQAPYFLFLKDTNGDDRADVKEILIEGWGTFDTHAGPSNLMAGIDNNIYGWSAIRDSKEASSDRITSFARGCTVFTPQRKNSNSLPIPATIHGAWG